MNKTASKKRESPNRGKKPTTYRRIVTENVNGKAVVQSDEPLLAYEFKTVPGYEHTLIWINPVIPDLSTEQEFDRYPDSVVPGTWRHEPAPRDVSAWLSPRGSVFRWRSRTKRSIGSPARISRSLRKRRSCDAQNEHRRLCSCLP